MQKININRIYRINKTNKILNIILMIRNKTINKLFNLIIYNLQIKIKNELKNYKNKMIN